MKRIKRFGVVQTAKISAIIYFLIALVLVLPFSLISSMFGGMANESMPMGGGIFLIFIPFFYGIAGFFMTAISCLIYNAVAKYSGGIEVEVETMES